MRRLVILFALAALALGGATARATTCNIDFTAHISGLAYDFALVLPTHATIVQTYNGTSGFDDVFSGVNISYPGTSTVMDWVLPQSPIGNGSQIHVGWTTSANTCPPCITGYFTDQNGQKITGTDITILVTDHVTGSSGFFINHCTVPIVLTNIRGACLSAPIPLADLNRTNTELGSQLRTLSSGTTLQPGGQLVVSLPTGTSCTYVLNYGISGQSNAQISPWVELP